MITVLFTCFVKSLGYDVTEKQKTAAQFCYIENGMKPIHVLTFENATSTVEVPSVVLNPNYHLSSQK